MALKYFAIEFIEQGDTTPIKAVNIKFLNSHIPISEVELFAERQELSGAIEEANKKGIKVNIII